MRTRISELMPGDAVLLLGRERTAILRLIIGGHEVRNDPEDSFGDFVAPLFVLILLVFISSIGRICNTALGVPGQDDQEQDENRKPPGLKRGCRFLSAELKSFARMALFYMTSSLSNSGSIASAMLNSDERSSSCGEIASRPVAQ